MSGKSYRDLVAWQRAMHLTVSVYKASQQFPREELYGLTSQIRRAAVSVPSNIAEGQGRGSEKDFLRFLSIAYGSLQEIETQLLLAGRLSYLDGAEEQTLLNLCSEGARLINGRRRNRKTRRTTGH